MSRIEKLKRQQFAAYVERAGWDEAVRWLKDGVWLYRVAVLEATRGNAYRRGWIEGYLVNKRMLAEISTSGCARRLEA